MANEIIKKQNFEDAKDRIYSALENVPTVSFESFPTEGSIFPWNKHNITGDEANRLLVSPLQDKLISQNERIKELFNIATDVYTTLDSLDKENIAGIVGAVKAAELASDQATTASSQALSASEEVKVAQDDIKLTIEALQKTIGILKDFKADVAKQAIPSKIANLASKVTKLEQDYNSVIQSFIEKVNQTTERINNDITALQQYRTILESYQHLGDVDAIWNDVEGHKNDIARIQEQLNTFISEVRITTNEIKESIKKQDEINTNAHLKYEKRIKTAYYIGGSAVGLSLINYLLQIFGIL